MLVELFPNHDQIKNDQILAVWAKKIALYKPLTYFKSPPKIRKI